VKGITLEHLRDEGYHPGVSIFGKWQNVRGFVGTSQSQL
jgi:hypothetical protein